MFKIHLTSIKIKVIRLAFISEKYDSNYTLAVLGGVFSVVDHQVMLIMTKIDVAKSIVINLKEQCCLIFFFFFKKVFCKYVHNALYNMYIMQISLNI